MQVKVTRDFRAVKPGDVYPSDIRKGDVVEGRLAEIALENKHGTIIPGGDINSDVYPPGYSNQELLSENIRLNAMIHELTEKNTKLSEQLSEAVAKLTANEAAPTSAPEATAPSTPDQNQPATSAPTPAPSSAPAAPTVLRAKLKDRYEGVDAKGKALKFAKGAIVGAPLAQNLVDQGLATVIETAPNPAVPQTP